MGESQYKRSEHNVVEYLQTFKKNWGRKGHIFMDRNEMTPMCVQ